MPQRFSWPVFCKKNICCVQIVGVVTISLYLPVPGNVYITIILDLQVLINVDIYNNYTKSKYGSVRCIYYNHTRSTYIYITITLNLLVPVYIYSGAQLDIWLEGG